MRIEFSVNDMTMHRIVEQEQGFTPMLEFLPTVTRACAPVAVGRSHQALGQRV